MTAMRRLLLSFKWETQGWAQDESTRGGGSQGSLAGLACKGKAKGLTSLVGSRTDFTFFALCTGIDGTSCSQGGKTGGGVREGA